MKDTRLNYDNGTQRKTITCWVPESWDEISWKQFTQTQEILVNEDLDTAEKGIHRAAILTGVSVADLGYCDFQQVVGVMQALAFTKDLPDPDITKATQVITVAGKRYHAVELHNLADLTAAEKIHSAEGVSFEEKGGLLMAVFLRQELPSATKWYQRFFRAPEQPRLEGFNGEPGFIESRKRLFTENLSVVQVINLAAFFLKAAVASQLPTLDYSLLHQALLRQNRKMEELFGRVMGGPQPGTLYAKMLWSMKHFYSCQSAKYFRGSNTTK